MSTQVSISTPESGPNAPEKETPPGDRPAWLPENFQTPEALADSHKSQRSEITRLQQELAKKNGTTPPEAPKTDPAVKKPGEQTTQDDAAKDVAKAAGFDLNPFQSEYSSTGDVSEDGRAQIAKGLEKVLGPNARQLVDEYVEARKVVHTNDRAMFMDAAGGEESYAAMSEWAKASLSPQEIRVYNAQVESGDRHSALFALEGLKAKYQAAEGVEPKLLGGGGGNNDGASAFKSSAEMTRAMKDPRYTTDEAYRNQVKARLAQSNF